MRNHILSLLSQQTLTFNQILKQSYNCDPALLLHVLEELADARKIVIRSDVHGSVKYAAQTGSGPNSRSRKRPGTPQKVAFSEETHGIQADALTEANKELAGALPEASPVFSQWWFSPSTHRRLLELMLRLTAKTKPAAFLASGGLGAVFSLFSKSPVRILDIDHVLLHALKGICPKRTDLIEHDALKPFHRFLLRSHHVVLVDPPWGMTQIPVFLVRGAELLAEGGRLVISFPQRFTRPNINRERQNLLRLAGQLGLVLKEVQLGATEYTVPVFERDAYKLVGIHLQEPWRRGDLFIFQRTRKGRIPTVTNQPTASAKWEQYLFGACRVFLKRDGEDEQGPPRILPFWQPGLSVYPSTSSRSESWRSASLVTSHNAIARALGRAELSRSLNTLSRREVFSSAHCCEENPGLREPIDKYLLRSLCHFPF